MTDTPKRVSDEAFAGAIAAIEGLLRSDSSFDITDARLRLVEMFDAERAANAKLRDTITKLIARICELGGECSRCGDHCHTVKECPL